MTAPAVATAPRSRDAELALVALFCVNIVWGMNLPFSKQALADLDPLAFNVARSSLSLFILIPLGLRGNLIPCIRRNWRMLAFAGLTGLTVSQTALAFALTLTPAAIVAILHSLGPLIIVLLAMPFLGERMSRLGWMGMALGSAGALMVLGLGTQDFEGSQLEAILGSVIILMGLTSWYVFNIVAKRMLVKEDAVAMAAGATIFGWVGLLIIFFSGLSLGHSAGHFTWWGIFGVLYSGLLNRGGAFLTHNWALKRVEASRVAAFAYIIPVVGVVGSWIVVGEQPGLIFIAGAALALAGVYLVTRAHVTSRLEEIIEEPVAPAPAP